MIITILWEDQREGQTRGFGPHELLVACVADEIRLREEAELGETERYKRRKLINELINSIPCKGNGGVVRKIKQSCELLKKNPVVVVIDHDKILDIWPPSKRPNPCKTEITKAFLELAPGNYDFNLLSNNIETLVDTSCDILGKPKPTSKPSLDERDRILNELANKEQKCRAQIRQEVQSFDRLVKRVAKTVEPHIR